MSKLNDSTLKILQKYRLNTNMSVFGNENELYNVIKVMDDMVGNQISNTFGYMQYLDSTDISEYAYMKVDDGNITTNPKSYVNNKTYSFKPGKYLWLDPFSFKIVKYINSDISFDEILSHYLVNMQTLKQVAYCTMNSSKTDGIFSMYSDIGTHDLIQTSIPSGKYRVQSYIIISNVYNSPVTSSCSIETMFSSASSSPYGVRTDYPNSKYGILALPDFSKYFDKNEKLYVSFGRYTNPSAAFLPEIYSELVRRDI